MSLDEAIRLTEMLMGFAFFVQCIEHIKSTPQLRSIFIPRLVLSLMLIIGVASGWVLLCLFFLALIMLHQFQGPYNGGSDRMSLLVLCCLCLTYLAPSQYWREVAFGYLGLQLVLSYFISGWVKVVNPQWRSGQALVDVFRFSAYPVSESLRGWVNSPSVLWSVSWAVMGFELLFPLSLVSPITLWGALVIAAMFHFSNACFFGLNRFFWIWISAYPAIIWLQQRVGVGILG